MMKKIFHYFFSSQKIYALILLLPFVMTQVVNARQLQISELYFDGANEWIEIANIGSGDFNDTIALSGVRTNNNILYQPLFIPAGESRVIADELTGFLDLTSVVAGVNKLSITDTQAIDVELLVSGVHIDQFTVPQASVASLDNTQTSFELLNGMIIPVSSQRVSNIVSGFTANPGVFGLFVSNSGANNATGSLGTGTMTGSNIMSGQVYCPMLSGYIGNMMLSEIYPVSDDLPVYLEIEGVVSYSQDLEISGTLLAQSITVPSFSILPGQRIVLAQSLSGLHHSQDVLVVTGLLLGQSGTIELYNSNQELIDAIAIESGQIWSGISFYETVVEPCYRVFTTPGSPSPGFDELFLSYLQTQTVVQTVTQTVYVPQTGGTTNGSCSNNPSGGNTSSGTVLQSGFTGSIAITLIDYDPPGSDTNNERIGMTLLSGANSLDLSQGRSLRYDGKNYSFSQGTVLLGQELIMTANYVFVNSRPVCIDLVYSGTVFDTQCYDPSTQTSPLITGQIQTTTGQITPSTGQPNMPVTYNLTIGDILYDPPGPDANNEQITILSSEPNAVDLTPFRIRVNGTNKVINTIIEPFQHLTITKTRGLPNSVPTCVELILGNMIIEEKCYDPQDDTATQTGSIVLGETGTNNNDEYVGTVSIINIVYDPPGADKDNETIELISSGSSVNFADGRYLMINGRRKSLQSFGLRDEGIQMLTGNFAFPNNKNTCVDLYKQELLMSSYCYEINDSLPHLLEEPFIAATEIPLISIISVLPNPLGKDTDKEQIVLKLLSGAEAVNLQSGYMLSINGNNKKLSGLLSRDTPFTLSGSRGLPNSASCIQLMYYTSLVDEFCYGTTKEGVVYTKSNDLLSSFSDDIMLVLNAIKHKNTKEQVCSTYQTYEIRCTKKPKQKIVKSSSQELRIARAYIAMIEQELKSEWYILRNNSVLAEYGKVYRQAISIATKGETIQKIDGIDVFLYDLELQHTLLYNRDRNDMMFEATMSLLFAL